MAKSSGRGTKRKTPTRAKRSGGSSRAGRPAGDSSGKHLVIVESPAKAKTINQYLGAGYTVQASVGHVRDLPQRAPKGSKQPVPGVDLENDFEPTYEVLAAKKKTVASLKRAARDAADIWFATDLDREGEAIAWHLAQELGVDPGTAKRVIFNAITKSQIQAAFQHPHAIDMDKVNAQQARRILDRIVGYQVSPLLWKKVARGLSAGRVQSVAVKLVVEREREIRAFVPDEYWRVTARMALDPSKLAVTHAAWDRFSSQADERDRGPTQKAQNAWLSEHGSIRAELAELQGEKFELGCPASKPRDLSGEVQAIADAVGLLGATVTATDDPKGRGPAATVRTVTGRVDPAARYRVRSVGTKRVASKPGAPFITASLQRAAASSLGFSTLRTMRTAQSLYEGVQIAGEGQVGLITYMRTDSTHVAPEAIDAVRDWVRAKFGNAYVPESSNVYGSSTKAQEAHEAIRPTDVNRHPDDLAGALDEGQRKLYRLIWSRFVACQMTPAQWDSTTVMLERSDRATGAVFKTTGRVLAFDGFYRATGVPNEGDEQLLPDLREGHVAAPFSIEPEQLFTSPPPRYSEASLVKELEEQGIGRPSTYASIIQVIQDRSYVEQIDRRFFATDLGEVVTEKLIEAFADLMDTGYTRQMEEALDRIEEQHTDWKEMLRAFYGPFEVLLARAHETMTHAKAERRPAMYKCPDCGRQTCYRFGKNGRFLSCSGYPACKYAAPIDRDGRPLLPEQVDVACPVDGSQMELRNGRFGPFLASVNYPAVDFVVNVDRQGRIKLPAPPPLLTDLACSKCGQPLNLRRGLRGPWLGCSAFPKCKGRLAWTKLDDAKRATLSAALDAHERDNPPHTLCRLDGTPIAAGTPVTGLIIPRGVAELEIHPAAAAQMARARTA